MKLLMETTDYEKTITIAKNLTGEYDIPVLFHCYWNGKLSEKHLYSIQSCYYFHVLKGNHKIILWLENNIQNKYNDEIEKYAEIRYFNLEKEKKQTFLENRNFGYNGILSFFSDVVRYILLYKYGGCWFDLDCFFLRSFEPLFLHYEKLICVYQWENQNYPNGAIYISLEPKSEKMKQIIEFIINRNRGWGFQEANLTYDLPLDLLVLPCSWFDASWIENPDKIRIETNAFFNESEKQYDFTNFFHGAFCYHWHNKWNVPIHEKSIIKQLVSKMNT